MNGSSQVFAGAKLTFYKSGTTTKQDTYTDSDLTVAHSNPVVADSAGYFDPIYLDASLPEYKCVLSDSADTILQSVDPLNPIDSSIIKTSDLLADLEAITDLSGMMYVLGRSSVGDGYEGLFLFTSGNHTADVTADISQAIWVAPSSDPTGASGAWKRQHQSINIKWFGAVGDGITDDSAAIGFAKDYVYANNKSLYFPAGTYLVNTQIVSGNTVAEAATYCHFFGDGPGATIIKTTTTNVNPFLWQGPNPDVDGATNRIDGRILLEGMRFQGPSSGHADSLGVKFYGAQGIVLRDITCDGWTDGIHFQNCDIVTLFNPIMRLNAIGINSSCTGYALTGAGQLNSFTIHGGLIANNSNRGISYVGGISPAFFGVNFVLNGVSITMSLDNPAGPTVTQSPYIAGCYFEGDLSSCILLGGGNGIVRTPIIDGGFMISAAATALITVANASNALGRGRINIGMDTGYPGSSQIDQTSSVEKIDFYSYNGMPIGDVTPSTGVFTSVQTAGSFINSGAANGYPTMDVAPGQVAVANSGTVNFPNFSGVITVNNYTSGAITIFACGGGTVAIVGGVGSTVGSVAYNGAISGYTWTNTYGATATFSFETTRTRTAG